MQVMNDKIDRVNIQEGIKSAKFKPTLCQLRAGINIVRPNLCLRFFE